MDTKSGCKNDPIDFVIPWVDGNDPEWCKKRDSFQNAFGDASNVRYRNWENLCFWFRSVEKYAPWVRKIHFVSDGQIPKWLNTTHPKINIVNHRDYIPEKYLPLFNSNAIEAGIYLIPGLAEKFVYFNDDVFLTAPVAANYYYQNDKPCDTAVFTVKPVRRSGDMFTHIRCNDYDLLNKYFKKNEVVFQHPDKFFNPEYGLEFNLRNLINLCHFGGKFDGFHDLHVSIPYLKHEWEEVWAKEPNTLSNIRKYRFRNADTISQWVYRYWRICKGEFIPKRFTGKYFGVTEKTDIQKICNAIMDHTYTEICINDEWMGEGYETARNQINEAFLKTLPEKSRFEI